MRGASPIFLLCLAGCFFDTSFEGSAYRCSDNVCPEQFQCVQDRCIADTEIDKAGGTLDLGGIAPPAFNFDERELAVLWINGDTEGSLWVELLPTVVSGSTFFTAAPEQAPVTSLFTSEGDEILSLGYIAVFPKGAISGGLIGGAGPGSGDSLLAAAAWSIDHMVVYKRSPAAAPLPPNLAWTQAFDTGVSCGECQRDVANSLDTLTPCLPFDIELTEGSLAGVSNQLCDPQ